MFTGTLQLHIVVTYPVGARVKGGSTVASGIPFHMGPRPIQGAALTWVKPPQQTLTISSASDSFTMSTSSQPEAQPGVSDAPQVVDFRVTKEQLSSATLKLALSTVASQGMHVNITLVSAAEAQPYPTYTGITTTTEGQLSLEERFGKLSHTTNT